MCILLTFASVKRIEKIICFGFNLKSSRIHVRNICHSMIKHWFQPNWIGLIWILVAVQHIEESSISSAEKQKKKNEITKFIRINWTVFIINSSQLMVRHHSMLFTNFNHQSFWFTTIIIIIYRTLTIRTDEWTITNIVFFFLNFFLCSLPASKLHLMKRFGWNYKQ